MYCIKNNKGFAVLTSALLLSLAGIIFTTHLASTQLLENKVVANHYRNNEAFTNAESGINLILSQIDESNTVLASLPFTYKPVGSYYSVTIERLSNNVIEIRSLGTSSDGSAERMIELQLYHQVSYNIPVSPLASNGKLNLDSTTNINEGCEGVSAANCKSPGNIAKYLLVTNPSNETQTTECTGEVLGNDQVSQNSLSTDSQNNSILRIGEQISVVDTSGNTVSETITWPGTLPANSSFYDVAASTNSPSTLFESTFGLTREAGINALQTSVDVATIDMTLSSAMNCSTELANVSDEITTIYIQGDCVIDQNDSSTSVTSENKRLTIGSVDNPKMVFIEGGTFIAQPNTSVSVVGILYYLPGTQVAVNESGDALYDDDGNEVLIVDQSVDMSGARVNGAALSDYNCSHDNSGDDLNANPNFSIRYDKAVLNTLYKNIGRQEVSSGYRVVDGSWRDFG